MGQNPADSKKSDSERIAEEDLVQEKVDASGNRWKKVYVGGGAHFRNWYSQTMELRGEENVEVEEVHPGGFQCYEQSGERLYRIWVREKS